MFQCGRIRQDSVQSQNLESPNIVQLEQHNIVRLKIFNDRLLFFRFNERQKVIPLECPRKLLLQKSLNTLDNSMFHSGRIMQNSVQS